ncbi:MAG: hypothetical protein AAFN78_08810 [Pseudomonadota bacterium]
MRSTPCNQRRTLLPVLLLALTGLAGAAPALAALQPMPGLVMHSDSPSRHRIELVVYTDIGEPAFLAALRQSVETHWNQAPAMLAAGLRIELSITYVPADPQSTPQDRLAQFPEDALVLTTGLRSMPSRRVRSVPPVEPLPSGEMLALEIGHLLGFNESTESGEVSEEMVRDLFNAYGSEPYVCPCDAPE